MKVNNVVINSFQANFVKELMGDAYMTDSRAEVQLAKVATKFGVDALAMLNIASAAYDKKHAEFKRLQAEEDAQAKA